MADHAQHDHEPGCGHATGVVVGDHRRSVTDSEPPHGPREMFGAGQRMATRGGFGRLGEIGVDIDEHGPGQVAGLVNRPRIPTVEIPPHVDHHRRIGIG